MIGRAPAAMPIEVEALWPKPAMVELSRRHKSHRVEYLVAPGASRPRVLVPSDVPAAAQMLVRHGGDRIDNAVWGGWRFAVRKGFARLLPLARLGVQPDPQGIEAFVADAVGQPVKLGVLLGPARANRKPVLQIFDESGRTIAFAKLGLTALTERLLATEADALTRLSTLDLTSFAAPTPLFHGAWNGAPVLIQEALSSTQQGKTPTVAPQDVMVEIAGVAGITSERLASSTFMTELKPSPEADWHGIDVSAFARLHALLVAADPDLAMGSWHGDFGPWNMAIGQRVMDVWDWERFATGVPVGLDAAHYRTQVCVGANTAPLESWDQIVRDVARLLAASARSTDTAASVAASYLLAICARYRRDADRPTAALRRRMAWLSETADIAVTRVEVPSA